MSTPPDLVPVLSQWLAGHVDTGQLREQLSAPGELGPESQELVAELRGELDRPDISRPKLQPLVRETIEALALGQ